MTQSTTSGLASSKCDSVSFISPKHQLRTTTKLMGKTESKKQSQARKLQNFWLCVKHAWQQQGLLLVGYAVAITLVVAICHPFAKNANFDWYASLSNVLGAATLGVSLFVWFGARRQQWESSLPKRLTVVYFYNGNAVMACERATLMSESELRATSQQMGAQLAGGRLGLGPVFHVTKPKIETLPDIEGQDQVVRHYQMWMTLTELPQVLVDTERNPNGDCVLVRRVRGQEFQDVFEANYQIADLKAEPKGSIPLGRSNS